MAQEGSDGAVLSAALLYASRGWHVFPCDPATKRPLTAHGLKDATTDPDMIREWWTRWPRAMIGVPTGSKNRLWVVDADIGGDWGEIDGVAELAKLQNGHDPIGDTVLSTTPRGGQHYLFRWVDGIRNSAGKIATGIDVRGDGGYIIVPPSARADGALYRWENPPGLFDPIYAPAWLVAAARGVQEKPEPKPNGHDGHSLFKDKRRDLHPYVDAALRGERGAVEREPKGSRNDRLNRAAFSLGQLIHTGKIDDQTIRAELKAAAYNCGLIRDDGLPSVLATIASGISAGVAKPRDIPDGYRSGLAHEYVTEDGEIIEDEIIEDKPWEMLDPGPFPASDLTGKAVERTWIVKDWIAEGVVNSLYGQGGVGKTLLAQQLAYCLASTKPFLGIPVEKKKVLCVLCEDDRDEIHRRHDCIKAGLGVVIGNPFNDVWLWPRVGYDNLLVTWDKSNRPTISKQFQAILDQVLDKRLDFLILDTLADMYGGNEIVRVQVNHFLKTVLGRLILEARAKGFTLTVLLLAHPSTAGLNTGTGLSGSTAWENAVRSRLYLRLPEEGSSDERELVRAKANYANSGEDTVIRLLWKDGMFFPTNGKTDSSELAIKSAKQHARKLITEAYRSKRGYTERKGHNRNIYTACVNDLAGCGVNREAALTAIRELIEDGEVVMARGAKGARGYRIPDENDE